MNNWVAIAFLEDGRNVKRIKKDPTNPGLFWIKRVVTMSFRHYAAWIYMNLAMEWYFAEDNLSNEIWRGCFASTSS